MVRHNFFPLSYMTLLANFSIIHAVLVVKTADIVDVEPINGALVDAVPYVIDLVDTPADGVPVEEPPVVIAVNDVPVEIAPLPEVIDTPPVDMPPPVLVDPAPPSESEVVADNTPVDDTPVIVAPPAPPVVVVMPSPPVFPRKQRKAKRQRCFVIED
jgi:hypothetical protein